MENLLTIQVEAKMVGKKSPLFTDWHVPLPPEFSHSGRKTLRDLISLIVMQEVEAFRERQEKRRLAQVLSPAEIEAGAARGKIDLGERDLDQEVDEHEAVGVALQAFEDGLYYVFLDEVQQENLDQTVFVGPNSRLMFIRLVALVGG